MATQVNSTKANFQIANCRLPAYIKNLTIGESNQPGQCWIKNVQGYTTISGGIVTASGIALQLSNTATASTTLSGTGEIENKDQAIITMSLTNADDRRLFAFWNSTVYQDSVATANRIPDGDNVDPADYEIVFWTDWGTTDNNDVKNKVFVRNLDAAVKSIVFRGNWRYVIEEAT